MNFHQWLETAGVIFLAWFAFEAINGLKGLYDIAKERRQATVDQQEREREDMVHALKARIDELEHMLPAIEHQG